MEDVTEKPPQPPSWDWPGEYGKGPGRNALPTNSLFPPPSVCQILDQQLLALQRWAPFLDGASEVCCGIVHVCSYVRTAQDLLDLT